MKRKTSHSYQVQFREQPPKLEETKSGGTLVLCPFCDLPHPLWPGQEASCGTSLKVTALQTVIPGKLAKQRKLVCLKCHQAADGTGDMVRFMTGFIHLKDCLPESRLITEPPKFSKWAERVFKMSKTNKLRQAIEKRSGQAQIVREIDPLGNDTGKVLGYFFYKKK